MGARLYDPYTGRFTSTDPIPGGSANNYDYCGQDPINNLDLSGTMPMGAGTAGTGGQNNKKGQTKSKKPSKSKNRPDPGVRRLAVSMLPGHHGITPVKKVKNTGAGSKTVYKLGSGMVLPVVEPSRQSGDGGWWGGFIRGVAGAVAGCGMGMWTSVSTGAVESASMGGPWAGAGEMAGSCVAGGAGVEWLSPFSP
jgi:hypothetical protein